MACNIVMGAIKDSLKKPGLHPRAREVLERRLEHHQEKVKRRKRLTGNLQKAWQATAARRQEKLREVLPLVMKLRGEGCTYREIEEYLRRTGVTNTWDTPYSRNTIAKMVRENCSRPTPERMVEPLV